MSSVIQQFLAGANVSGTFDIQNGDDVYHCDQILRLLPGRRLVVRARLNEQQLLLKLFVPNKKGWRELSREQRGYRLCVNAGITVPREILISDDFAGCLAVAYEFLADAQPFALTSEQQPHQIIALYELMVQCHQAGLYQQDLHTGNILVVGGRLYLIDLASVTGQPGQPLPAGKSLKNLALLIAQFIPDEQRVLLEKLNLYYRARGWAYDKKAVKGFKAKLDKAWQKRKNTYLSKCFRACSMTAYKKTTHIEFAFKRDFFKRLPQQLSIIEMEKLVAQGKIIKDGNSATVVMTSMGGRQVVIKRYNIKSPLHFLRRCWRPSRAANAWRQGNLLELLGIATPQVLGFVEQRHGVLRNKAFLISEYVPRAIELSRLCAEQPPAEAVVKQIRRIFSLMAAYRLTHGDMKASNLLVNDSGCVEMIDLDAMREHRHEWLFRRAFTRDQQRFVSNWTDQVSLEKFRNSVDVGRL